MTLNFTVNSLSITHTASENPVNDSTNYVTAQFDFTGEPWDKASVRTAIFHQLNKAYSVILNEENCCYIPFEVLKNGGFAVGVMTAFEEENVTKTVYTKMCIVSTSPSCYSEYFANPEVTPSQYEQIMSILKSGIDVVKVNGETLTVTDKTINIPVPKNTSDLVNDNGFVSLAMLNEALKYKQNAVKGKGLSSNDFTDADKEKLTGIENGAQVNVIEKISVNGTEAEVSEKGVNISVPTETQIKTLSGAEIAISAEHNTEFRFTDVLTSLTLTLPDNSPDDYISWLAFKSGTEPTSIIYPDGIKWSGDSITDGEFVPETNTIYDIGLWHNGISLNGVVRGVTNE